MSARLSSARGLDPRGLTRVSWGLYSGLGTCLGQGLSYRAQLCPVTVTKIWTPYSQTNFFYQYTKKILTSRAFHPCITLGVKDNRKLVEKIFEVKKLPRNGTFCLPLFLVTQVWAVVMAKFAIGSYLSKLPNVLP